MLSKGSCWRRGPLGSQKVHLCFMFPLALSRGLAADEVRRMV